MDPKAKVEEEIEVPPEMIDAAMKHLWGYKVAWEYVDRDMMTEILRAALHVWRTREAVQPIAKLKEQDDQFAR
jgi:hypothetical protein